MNKTFLLLPILISCALVTLEAQHIGFDDIDEAKISTWVPKFQQEYSGVYHFGDSEMESTLILIMAVNGSKGQFVVAQIRSGSFTPDGSGWIWNYTNLKEVRIEGSKFYSSKSNGEFVLYDQGSEKIKALKVLNPWSGIGSGYELGPWSHSLANHFSGAYTKASTRWLMPQELAEMDKQQLKIMRNEIFARYGHTFKKGGEMDTYFRNQDWYSAQHPDATSFLTSLEKDNIRRIQEEENRR